MTFVRSRDSRSGRTKVTSCALLKPSEGAVTGVMSRLTTLRTLTIIAHDGGVLSGLCYGIPSGSYELREQFQDDEFSGRESLFFVRLGSPYSGDPRRNQPTSIRSAYILSSKVRSFDGRQILSKIF